MSQTDTMPRAVTVALASAAFLALLGVADVTVRLAARLPSPFRASNGSSRPRWKKNTSRGPKRRRLRERGDRATFAASSWRMVFSVTPERTAASLSVRPLAAYGRAIAEREVPWLRPPAASDVGHGFLEHTLVLNDVLVGLVLGTRRGPSSSLADLPFGWLSENDETLSFRTLDTHRGWQHSVLKPDAVVPVPARRARLFVEAETGSQSIATANPNRTGSVLGKLARYREFLSGLDPEARAIRYRNAFPDGSSRTTRRAG